MNGLKLYAHFYRSTLLINWSTSIFFSLILYPFTKTAIIYNFSLFSMTLGFIVAILVKESSFLNKDEYYFYYNFGISKIKLIILSSFMNILFSSIIIIGYFYGKQYITN